VPEGAADLAVGDGRDADLLLQADDVADRLVLDGLQLGGVDRLVVVVLLARCLDRIRSKQAADMVGTEGRLGGSCVGRVLARGNTPLGEDLSRALSIPRRRSSPSGQVAAGGANIAAFQRNGFIL
jgi:hypothetical protein